MTELLFQCVKLWFGLVIIAFKLRYLHKRLQVLAALAVILESAFYHSLLEVLIIRIAYLEILCRRNRRMVLHELQFPCQHHLRRVMSG